MCYDLPRWISLSRLSKKFLVGYAILKDFSYLFARNSPVENSTGDVMAWRRRRSLGQCTTSCIEAHFAHFEELMTGRLVASLSVTHLLNN